MVHLIKNGSVWPSFAPLFSSCWLTWHMQTFHWINNVNKCNISCYNRAKCLLWKQEGQPTTRNTHILNWPICIVIRTSWSNYLMSRSTVDSQFPVSPHFLIKKFGACKQGKWDYFPVQTSCAWEISAKIRPQTITAVSFIGLGRTLSGETERRTCCGMNPPRGYLLVAHVSRQGINTLREYIRDKAAMRLWRENANDSLGDGWQEGREKSSTSIHIVSVAAWKQLQCF